MYSLHHSTYCGMSHAVLDHADRVDVRTEAARQLRRYRRNGFPVSILARGREWEIGEPDGCAMVPDSCGVLNIWHTTYECRECGFGHDTRDAAAECCAIDWECE